MTARHTYWSRRRQAVEAEARQQAEARLASEEAEALAVQEQKADEDLLKELGLPDPDTLKAGDDFSAFMAKAVPTRLRNRALRKLWVSNPVLANLDDLVDYAEDYRTAGLTGGVVQTTYKVGKGLMKHVEELARIEEEATAPAELAASGTDTHSAEDTEKEMAVAAPKRRMRFVVEANA